MATENVKVTAPETVKATAPETVKVTTPEKLIKQVKDDLVTKGDLKLSEADIKAVINSAFANIISQVESGQSVTFTNLVTFKRALRGARVHKNPKTGEPIEKGAHYVMTMELKSALKKHFSGIEVTEQASE